MLPPEIIKKIKKLHIKTGRRVNTLMMGHYKSAFRGSGMEFEEVREYSPGDDIKSIDWKVTARMGKPFVKTYREEREQVVMLLVDMSASGLFGTGDSSMREKAAEIASILAFSAIKSNDNIGAVLFTDKVEKYIPPQKGPSHVWRVIKEIVTFTPESRGTDIINAVRYFGNIQRKRSVCFLISDFLTGMSDQTDRNVLKILSRKHETICVVLSDPGEFHLPESGIFSVEDLETGKRVFLDAGHAPTRTSFEKIKKAAYDKRIETLKKSDMDIISISTGDDAADELIRYFRIREKRLR